MKVNKLGLPFELTFELIAFIRLTEKWENIRVSKLFDIFILKFQKKFVIHLKIYYKLLIGNIDATFVVIFQSFDDIEDYHRLPNHALLAITHHFDAIFAASSRFIERMGLQEVLEAVSWPKNKTKYVFSDASGTTNQINDKMGYLRIMFNSIFVYVTNMLATNNSGRLSAVHTFLEDQLAILQLIIDLCLTFGKKINKRKKEKELITVKKETEESDDEDDPTKPSTSKKKN